MSHQLSIDCSALDNYISIIIHKSSLDSSWIIHRLFILNYPLLSIIVHRSPRFSHPLIHWPKARPHGTRHALARAPKGAPWDDELMLNRSSTWFFWDDALAVLANTSTGILGYTGTGWGLRRIWAPGMWSRPQTLLNVYLRASHLIGHYNVSDMCLKWPSWGFGTCKHVSEHRSFKRSKASKLFQSFKVIQALPSAGADHLRRFWAEPAGRSNFGAVSWQLDMMPSQCLGCDLKWCSTFLSRIQFACSDYHSDFFWFAASAPSDVLRLTTSNWHGCWVCCVCKNLLLCVSLRQSLRKPSIGCFGEKVVENHYFLYHRMCVKVSHSPPWRPKKKI